MGDILVKNKEVVVPGEKLAKGMDYLPSNGSYREGEDIISSILGMASTEGRVVKVIPLSGGYTPKEGDMIIGEVVDINFGGWMVDIGTPYSAMLSLRDVPEYVDKGDNLEKHYGFGNIVFAKVTRVTRSKNIDLSLKGPGLGKLTNGRIMRVTPSKVPRIIGKSGSMISMIKEKTNCKITVGQNGKVWIRGNNIDDELKVTKAIQAINDNSHKEGLTESINEMLEVKEKVTRRKKNEKV